MQATVYNLRDGSGAFPSPWVNQFAVPIDVMLGTAKFKEYGGQLLFCAPSLTKLPHDDEWPPNTWACAFVTVAGNMLLYVCPDCATAFDIIYKLKGHTLNWYFVEKQVFANVREET